MRVLIAPDSFKESLSATEACDILARACESVADENKTHVEVDTIPFSDGGEGFLDSLHARYQCAELVHNVQDPLGAPTSAHWSMLHDDRGWLASNPLLALGKALLGSILVPDLLSGSSLEHRRIAAIEMAQASGLHLVPPHKRNPPLTSTTGVGELIRRALDEGAGHIWIGLGGSATVDGGIGALYALGARFQDESNTPVPYKSNRPIARDLLDIHRVDLSGLDPRLTDTHVSALCDVNNPLLGENGAAPTFAPQKGATPDQVTQLDEGLHTLAEAFARSGHTANPVEPMTGAAGGLAFALQAGLSASLLPGASFLAARHSIADRLPETDLLVLAEGRLDATSFQGKVVGTLADMALEVGVPTLIIAGQADPHTIVSTLDRGIHVRTLVDDPAQASDAIRNTPELLLERTREALRPLL
ncbi:MAG: glycerate kinase [Planctomycetota bacterium]|jgi:glycerate kinase